MKITESKLRSIIKSVLSESELMPEDYLQKDFDHREVDFSPNMKKAEYCRDMSKQELIDMCDKICKINPKMAIHCIELCSHCCRGDVMGCCRCLDEICKCIHCEKVCSEFCGC